MAEITTPTLHIGPLVATTGTFSGAVSMTALTATTGAFSSNLTVGGTAAVTGASTLIGNAEYRSYLYSTTSVNLTSFSATQFTAHANTAHGGVLAGFGTTNDVALANRAGSVVLGITANTLNATLAGALAVTGAVTLSSTLAFSATSSISQNTAEGSDNRYLDLAGGGAYGSTRGAGIRLFGNEYSGAGGILEITAGNAGDGYIALTTGAAERMRVAPGGQVLIGTTITTGGAAGDVVVGYQKGHRSVDSAGTGTRLLIKHTTTAAGTLVNDMTENWLQALGAAAASLPAAGASNSGIIGIDTTNNRLCYYSNGNRYYLTGTSF